MWLSLVSILPALTTLPSNSIFIDAKATREAREKSKSSISLLYSTMGASGGPKRPRKMVDAATNDLLSDIFGENAVDMEIADDDAYYNRHQLSPAVEENLSRGVSTTLSTLQDILFADDDQEKKVKRFSKNIADLKKSQFCKAMRLCRKLTFHMLELLNPECPLDLLDKITVTEFLKDVRYKDQIPEKLVNEAAEAADTNRKKHLQEDTLEEMNKRVKTLTKSNNRKGEQIQSLQQSTKPHFKDYSQFIMR